MDNGMLVMAVGQLVVQEPARAAVLEKFGIDYCCGGRIPLRQVCDEKGLDPQKVMDALRKADASAVNGDRAAARLRVLEKVLVHIESAHHDYVRKLLPKLKDEVDQFMGETGAKPELLKLRLALERFAEDLEVHMQGEEKNLFPTCRAIIAGRKTTPSGVSLNEAIKVMITEHDDSGDELERLYALTDGFAMPKRPSKVQRQLIEDLRKLQIDMHRHIYEENNLLSPLARMANAEG